MDEILKFLPEVLKQKIISSNMNNVEEIRVRTSKPVILKNNIDEKVLDYITTPEMVLQILQRVCDNSLYSYQSQISEGFITLKGGHRIGVVI